ncbi:hypothetical protein SDC9_164669 [bioreactor metagenome]|uniref:Uncharacterized protein n=1 Tax=bioreactor metagenome TaxID=1076179 RepID=A0A645FU76_9ZZZZ
MARSHADQGDRDQDQHGIELGRERQAEHAAGDEGVLAAPDQQADRRQHDREHVPVDQAVQCDDRRCSDEQRVPDSHRTGVTDPG